jgi:hypothetical protein
MVPSLMLLHHNQITGRDAILGLVGDKQTQSINRHKER